MPLPIFKQSTQKLKLLSRLPPTPTHHTLPTQKRSPRTRSFTLNILRIFFIFISSIYFGGVFQDVFDRSSSQPHQYEQISYKQRQHRTVNQSLIPLVTDQTFLYLAHDRIIHVTGLGVKEFNVIRDLDWASCVVL